MTCPRNFPEVENVDDLPATAVVGDMCWVQSTWELWIYAGNGTWTHQPPQPPTPPLKIHRSEKTPSL